MLFAELYFNTDNSRRRALHGAWAGARGRQGTRNISHMRSTSRSSGEGEGKRIYILLQFEFCFIVLGESRFICFLLRYTHVYTTHELVLIAKLDIAQRVQLYGTVDAPERRSSAK